MTERGLTYPAPLVQALFDALEHTAGPSSLAEVLAAANLNTPPAPAGALPFEQIAAFGAALETIYGRRGGRGIALRTGHTFFELGLREYGILKGVTAPEFAQLTPPRQAHITLLGLAAVFTARTGQATHLEHHPAAWHVVAAPSPFAWGRTTEKPTCHVLVGVLQASLRWATAGHEFAVYETSCLAAGAASCVFQVSKQPIGKI